MVESKAVSGFRKALVKQRARKKAQVQARSLGKGSKVVAQFEGGKLVGFQAQKTVSLPSTSKQVVQQSIQQAQVDRAKQAQVQAQAAQQLKTKRAGQVQQLRAAQSLRSLDVPRTTRERIGGASLKERIKTRLRTTSDISPILPTRERARELGQFLGDVRRALPATPGTPSKTFPRLSVEKQARVIETGVEEAISLPGEKPIQTIGFIALPEAFAIAETGAALVGGKATLQLAKRKILSPKNVQRALKGGDVLLKTAKGTIGAAFVGEKSFELKEAQTLEEKTRIAARTGVELGLIGFGSKIKSGITNLPSKRLSEIFEAKVGVFPETGPITVAASRFSTKENIEFAETVGGLGLKLSRKGIKVQPKRGIPFGEVQGVTPTEAGELQSFFVDVGQEGFVKGSVAQSTFFTPELKSEFIKVRGGKFSDIDVALTEGKSKGIPKSGAAFDIKELGEAGKITGAREPQVTPTGVPVQAFQEQAFRKSVGAFQLRVQKETGKPEFGRIEKDVRDLLFSAEQAKLEGVTGLDKSIIKIESSVAGDTGVTLKLTSEPKPSKLFIEQPRLSSIVDTKRLSSSLIPSKPKSSVVVPSESLFKLSTPSVVPKPSKPSKPKPSVSSLTLPSKPKPSPSISAISKKKDPSLPLLSISLPSKPPKKKTPSGVLPSDSSFLKPSPSPPFFITPRPKRTPKQRKQKRPKRPRSPKSRFAPSLLGVERFERFGETLSSAPDFVSGIGIRSPIRAKKGKKKGKKKKGKTLLDLVTL